MFTEEKQIFYLAKNFLTSGCDVDKFNSLDISRKKIKCYFKKDENDCLCIYDKEFSIKCIFEKKFLKDYFKSQPGYINLESFDNCLVLLKKYHFDILLVRNINDTISVRIVLYILEFEVDLYQKKTCLVIKPNINRSIEIVNYIKNFMWKFSQEYTKNFDFDTQLLQAKNFILNNFHNNENPKKIETSIIKIMDNNLQNILINENISIENNNLASSIVNILEENDELPIINDNINLENILKFDFKKLLNFEINSSHESLHNNLYNFKNDYLNNEKNDLFLGKKKYRMNEKIITEITNEYPNINENELEKLKNLKNDIIEK